MGPPPTPVRSEPGFSSRNGAQDIKKSGVSGHLQVEIEETVHQDAGATYESSESNGAIDVPSPFPDLSQAPSNGQG